MDSEKRKFLRFYIYSGALWLILLVSFVLGTNYSGNSEFVIGLLKIVLIFGVFGIPIIIILSFFIRFAEYLINKIPFKNKSHKTFNKIKTG